MSYKISVTVVGITHAGSPDTDVFQLAVLVADYCTDIPCFRVCFQHMQYVFITDAIQFAIFQRLYIENTFLLPEKAFKQYDHMIFFHKPGRYFMLIAFIITPYQALLQVPRVMAYFSFVNEKIIFLLPRKTKSIPQFGF